ncbi:MAG TPA: HepT-like ribonuclease domain-containing protein [Chthoniobacterales bacterium]|nr:HepT-like ribonuclease domain-containing protein [Chthoniobacterales bacterium]
MTVATKKLLLDVREAGESILQHTAGKNLAEYTAERFFRRAVEREFEIIGEALNRIDRLDPLVAARISELRPVVDFRNRIIHGMTQWTTRWCGASLKGICRS